MDAFKVNLPYLSNDIDQCECPMTLPTGR